MVNIIDTFPYFRDVFKDKLNLPVDKKIELWEYSYIARFPELERKCKSDYEDSGYSWRNIAETMVFNKTKGDFGKMIEAHENLLQAFGDINKKVKNVFGIEPDINVVLYCGLLNSAGWVTNYDGKRAILHGIDKIAELNWYTMKKIKPLIAHELCHVVHFELRGEEGVEEYTERNNYTRGIWRIYEEGFAQFYQQLLLGSDIDPRGYEWFEKCELNKDRLKKLYFEALYDEKKGTKEFYGDWFQVLGVSDAGYYLGAQLIKELSLDFSVKEIAMLGFDKISENVISFLKE